MADPNCPTNVKMQYQDNHKWITEAGKNQMAVGSAARILYSDETGRIKIALAFNQAVKDGKLSAPVVLSRDHHDVSGTDSPYRETSNIYDGSQMCADMAVQNFCGDAFRGATWVSLHNGGGVGWGEVMNGGFGMVLDGTDDAHRRAKEMLFWDVHNGVQRRAWSGHDGAKEVAQRAVAAVPGLQITIPEKADLSQIRNALANAPAYENGRSQDQNMRNAPANAPAFEM